MNETSGDILWGTSTWTYPGWQDIVYRDVAAYGKRFARESLAEYARCGQFECVGLDATFYRPPTPSTLRDYARMLPAGFPAVVKVWQAITAPFFTRHFGPTARASTRGAAVPGEGLAADASPVGRPNPDFLDPVAFRERFLPPFEAHFRDHVGAFVLEFPIVPPRQMSRDAWLERLDRFLGAVGRDWPLAVEVRSKWWLCDAYFEALARHGAAHCFDVWTRMPLPHEVLDVHPRALDPAPFAVCRALVAPGIDYEKSVRAFEPYDRLVSVHDAARASLLALARAAAARGRRLLVTVNNRLEGCAPLTIRALRAELVSDTAT